MAILFECCAPSALICLAVAEGAVGVGMGAGEGVTRGSTILAIVHR